MGVKAVIILGILSIAIVGLFGVMCYLMMSVNPPPLTTEKSLTTQLPPKLRIPYNLENSADMTYPSHKDEGTQSDDYGVTEDSRNLIFQHSQIVSPPLWPMTPEPPSDHLDQPPEDETKRKEFGFKTTTYDMFIIGKRSVDDAENRKNDLDSIILKVTDDKGNFNVEIKIGTNYTSTKENNESREIQSKEIPKYSMTLMSKNNDLYKISELAKSTIIHVKANNSVSIDGYDDHLKSKRTVNDKIITASIVDLINSTDKSEVMPKKNDLWPEAFFSNKTKLTHHSDTSAKEIDKKDLSQKPNHTNKTNRNNHMTANDVAGKLTSQIKNTSLQTFVITRNGNNRT